MIKEEILALPIYPKYLVETNGNEIVHSSAVYVHYDVGDYVEVLLQPVKNMHITCKGVTKEMFLEQHLKHCLIISKYAEITSDFREWLPCVARLDKKDPDFTHTLHYTYP
jgi:hypothetical protein